MSRDSRETGIAPVTGIEINSKPKSSTLDIKLKHLRQKPCWKKCSLSTTASPSSLFPSRPLSQINSY